MKLYFSDDVSEFLFLLSKYQIKYMIVGGEAVIYYGHIRLTGDIDFFYENKLANCKLLFLVLQEFWNNNIPGIQNYKELMKEGMVFQFGIPPNRIDLVNKIEDTDFKSAWERKSIVNYTYKNNNFDMYYIGLSDLIKNKQAIHRYKDKEDLKFLKKLR